MGLGPEGIWTVAQRGKQASLLTSPIKLWALVRVALQDTIIYSEEPEPKVLTLLPAGSVKYLQSDAY
jgi:hypothetical protein